MFSISTENKIDNFKHSNLTMMKTSYKIKGRIKNETAKAVRAVSVKRPGTSSKLHVASIFSPFSKASILPMCALETLIQFLRIKHVGLLCCWAFV